MKTETENAKKAQPKLKEIVIHVKEDFVPADGDAFDAVVSALEHFDIPAHVFMRDRTE